MLCYVMKPGLMKTVREPPVSGDTPKYLTLHGRTKWK